MDKVIAITGGFGSLGSAAGRAFQAAGAQVALIDHAAAPVANDEWRDTLLAGGFDLTDPEQAIGCMKVVEKRFGRLDVLVNIAGGFAWETVEDGSDATWDRMFAINLKTALNATKAALPMIATHTGGRIVNVTAGAASRAGIGMGAYAGAKAGVARLTEALAEELKDRGITVNAVSPSIIDTPQNRSDMPDADFSRWVQPTAIADLILFLASDAASAITGALIPITNRC